MLDSQTYPHGPSGRRGIPSPRPALLSPVPRPGSWYEALLLPHPLRQGQEAWGSLIHPHPIKATGRKKGGTRGPGNTLNLGHCHQGFHPTGKGSCQVGGRAVQRKRGNSWTAPLRSLSWSCGPCSSPLGGLHSRAWRGGTPRCPRLHLHQPSKPQPGPNTEHRRATRSHSPQVLIHEPHNHQPLHPSHQRAPPQPAPLLFKHFNGESDN